MDMWETRLGEQTMISLGCISNDIERLPDKRDYFAGLAFLSLLTKGEDDINTITKKSFEYADKMIKRSREK